MPRGDPGRVAEALIRLIRDPGLRATLGRNARQRAETLFNISQTVQACQQVYMEMVCYRGRGCRAASRAGLPHDGRPPPATA